MDPNLVKAVIKNNVMDRHSGVYNSKSSMVSLSSVDDDDGGRSYNSLMRSPDGPMRGRSVKEFEEQLAALKKENFNLKIRIYFLEERMGANFNLDKENILKKNVELMVEIESLKKELQEKHDLLCQAVKAMDLEEDEFKKNAHAKNEEIMALKQEVEELKQQVQDGKYENDNDSSHKSYHSEPLFFSSKIGSMSDSSSKVRMLQERIAILENELVQEKENSASLQMIVDQADLINTKYEVLQEESTKKDETINGLRKELSAATDSLGKLSAQLKELEKSRDDFRMETQKLSRLLLEKSKAAEESEEHIAEMKRKYAGLKVEYERERQKYDRTKFVSDMRVTELEEDLEKQRTRVQDLQKKLAATGQELKENQNLLVPKSRNGRSIATNTDCDNVSVPNTATSPGVPQENALRNALDSRSPSKSPVATKTFDFDLIYKILTPLTFKTKPQLLKQLEELKNTLSASEQKIVRLKAQELKACALLKNLMQYHKTAEEQNQIHKERIMKLEKELEGVVSKPEGAQSNIRTQEKVDCSKEEKEYQALIQELENKLQILELTLKEKDIHIQYIEARNLELQNNIQAKEKDLIDLESSMSSQTPGTEKSKEISENTYSKLFEEKNKEIEKLNEELRKRTHDLQSVVNQELWQKNREIEKLQTKFTQLLENKEKEMIELKESFSTLSTNLNELRNENEEKHIENTNLKIDISDLKLQLQLLREKIGEIGLISDDRLEVEIIISSLDEMKNIQKQLEEVKLEKETLTQRINELEGTVQIYEGSTHLLPREAEIEKLRKNLKTSEDLRMQTTEVCHILRTQLEELAVFLDSLMKQKSVLGFLGSSQNRKLREAVEHSLDLSKSLNISLSMNPEQSLMQLSNITALLNCSDISNRTDSNRYSFSIMPDQATLTYQSHLFRVEDDNQDQQKSFTVKSLEDQIQMLQRELNMKNIELNRYRRESRNGKELRLSHSKPRISPSKLKNSITLRSEQHDSESEAWSEPDVNVSKARIGLFKEDKIAGIHEIHSSDSTDESLTQLDYKRADILNECQVTITKLSKQVQDLQAKLQEKESNYIELQEANDATNTLKEENEFLQVKAGELENELKTAKSELERVNERKLEIEEKLDSLTLQIHQLEKSEKELVDSHNVKNKELCDKINKMEVERDQLVNMATEYANMTETSRQEIIQLENKLTKLSIEKENLEVNLKKEYDDNLMREVKNVEKHLTDKIRETELKAVEQINEMTKKISELTENYTTNYVRKSEIVEKINEIEALNLELNVLREALEDSKKSAKLSELVEKSMKEEINGLQAKVNRVEAQFAEAVKEKDRLKKELVDECRKRAELERKYAEIEKEMLSLRDSYDKDVTMLHGYRSKLELKVSELEFSNADLHNRLAKLQSELNEQCRSVSPPVVDVNRSVPINQVPPYSRQISNNSQSYVSEDEVKARGVFSIVVPQKSFDSERIESNASPDLGIESDQGRFSSLEVVQGQVSRPLQQTLEIAESMNNLLDGDNNSLQGSTCDNKSCHQKSLELFQENNNLKKKLLKTRKALEDTVTQLTLANQRKKLVEKNICRQIHKTSQVLREAKANLDSGSETDFHKK
ncbi:centrosomin-like isoform X2 [Coccinella septempunctata]|uniref:centrosomin-like isoform X2 n=1 Tax=Coccinella septempunctata TaxID=41139 RepID=UPI001D06663D|nr:centrosomin-like isoform X2 [Coccinella septempunctata]